MRKNVGSNIKTLCARMKPVLCVIFVLRVMIRIMYTKNYVFEIILKCLAKFILNDIKSFMLLLNLSTMLFTEYHDVTIL